MPEKSVRANALPKKTAARKPAARKPAARVAPMPSEENIRLRAFQIWQQRGCPPGQALDNWLQAERELTLSSRGH